MLQRYAQLKNELERIQHEIAEIEDNLRQQVDKTGEIAGFGFRAYFKPGRKSTDHEAAARANGVWDDLIEKHSRAKVTISWAKITKEMGIVSLDEYTTQGEPVFVVEGPN